MYNLLNKENSKLIGKKVSDLSEEEKKNLKDYFQNKKEKDSIFQKISV